MNYKYNSQISKRAEIPECHLFNILDFIVLQHSKKLSVKECRSFLNITSLYNEIYESINFSRILIGERTN